MADIKTDKLNEILKLKLYIRHYKSYVTLDTMFQLLKICIFTDLREFYYFTHEFNSIPWLTLLHFSQQAELMVLQISKLSRHVFTMYSINH